MNLISLCKFFCSIRPTVSVPGLRRQHVGVIGDRLFMLIHHMWEGRKRSTNPIWIPYPSYRIPNILPVIRGQLVRVINEHLLLLMHNVRGRPLLEVPKPFVLLDIVLGRSKIRMDWRSKVRYQGWLGIKDQVKAKIKDQFGIIRTVAGRSDSTTPFSNTLSKCNLQPSTIPEWAKCRKVKPVSGTRDQRSRSKDQRLIQWIVVIAAHIVSFLHRGRSTSGRPLHEGGVGSEMGIDLLFPRFVIFVVLHVQSKSATECNL